MLRVMPITGTLVAMLVATPGAVGQVTSSQDTAKSPWPTVDRGSTFTFGDGVSADSSFIRQAIRGNYTEVALGRLADSRAGNSEVKDFAERMVEDHNSMNKEWIDLAHDNDMKVAVDFGQSGQQAIDRLEKLSGTAFDQAYMSEMIREHEQDLAAFQQMANSAGSSEVRQLASSGASTIREHLASAQQVGSRVGVSSTAGRAGGVPPVPAPSSDDRARRTTTDDRNNAENGDNRSDNELPTLGGADRTFVDNVLSDHLMHIRLAKRAERESEREAIRGLAERIDKDFTRWSERWEKFADRREAEVNSHLTRHNREKLQRLEKASDRNELDRAYADIVADHLEVMAQDFRDTRQKTQTPEIRRLIDDELPVIRDLLTRARQVDAKESQRDENQEPDKK
jgi:putative membrane protein